MSGFDRTFSYFTRHLGEVLCLKVGLESGKAFDPAAGLGVETPQPIQTYNQRQKVVKHLLDWIERREVSTVGKDEVAQMLADNLGIDYQAILQQEILQILSPSEVTKLARDGINVQLHTHGAGHLKRTLFLAEIEDNRRRILELRAKNPVHFCLSERTVLARIFRLVKRCRGKERN